MSQRGPHVAGSEDRHSRHVVHPSDCPESDHPSFIPLMPGTSRPPGLPPRIDLLLLLRYYSRQEIEQVFYIRDRVPIGDWQTPGLALPALR